MLPLKIALRFMRSSRAQTILVVIGISIGVSVQVFVGTLIGSLQQSLIERTIGNSPHVTVTSSLDDPVIMDSDTILAVVEDVDGLTARSVSADSPAFINEDGRTSSVLVRGWDLEAADQIYGILDNVRAGSAPSDDEVLVGIGLAEEQGIGPGDSVNLSVANGTRYAFTVAGVFDLGVSSIDDGWVITTLGSAQRMFSLGEGVTSVEFKVQDVFAADAVALEMSTLLESYPVQVDNWKDQNEQLLSGLQGQTISSLMIQVFVLAAVVIAIASVLAIKVVQKSKQIGILKAMGLTDGASSRVFLYEGLLLGLVGSVFGVVLGVSLLISFVTFATNPDGSPLIDLYLDYPFVIGSGVIAVLAAALAAVIPARKSSKLSPIEVIRNA
ncbi:MAG: ABC transporter permease [Thermoplasmata archaeon]|nr:ABC transporter permease [Thermoplasmata archaeon]